MNLIANLTGITQTTFTSLSKVGEWFAPLA
jgi:hypothetical protein